MYVSINNLTALLYFVIHSSELYIDSLSCNQSLCVGIKAEDPISFKSVESVADSYQFKTIHRFYNKKLLHCTAFLYVFFPWDFSCTNNNQKTKKSNIAMLVIKPVTAYFPLRKTDISKLKSTDLRTS